MSAVSIASDLLPIFLAPEPEDEALLRRYGPAIALRGRDFAERWVALLRGDPGLQSILNEAFLSRAQTMMEAHYAAILCADYDVARRRVLHEAGAVHQRMAMPIQWMASIYGLLAEDFQQGVEALGLPEEETRKLRHALGWRLQLDAFWLEEGFQQAAAQRRASREAFYLAITQVNRLLTYPQTEASEEHILSQVVTLLAETLAAPMVWIGIVRCGETELSLTAGAGPAAQPFVGIRLSVDPAKPEGNGPSGQAIRSGRPYICQRDDPIMAPWRELAMANGIEGFAGAPFYFGDGDRGILSIYRRDGETFPEDLIDLISRLAEDLGAFFGRRQTALELLRLRHYQKVVEILHQEMLRQPPPEILYQRLAQLLLEYTDALAVVVWIVIPGDDWLRQVAVEARDPERAEALAQLKVSLNPEHYPHGRMATARTYHAGAPIIIEDVWKDPDVQLGWGASSLWQGVRSLGGWPIFAGTGTMPVAVLMVESAETRYFSPELQSLLNQLVGSIHIALDEYHSRQQLAAERESHAWQAHHDYLTGLPNRLGLSRRLGDAMARALRHGRLLGVGILDLDDFKAINDTHGHATGDRLLMALAGRLSQVLRHTDFAARLGGDEFVLVLEDLRDLGDLETIISKVGQIIEAPFDLAEGLNLQVRGSIGLTIYPLDDSDADLLLRHSDQALYAKKAEKGQRDRFWGYYSDSLDQYHKAGRTPRSLLGSGGLRVFYQPILDLTSNRVVRIEALARLKNSEGVILLPKEFLPQFNLEDQRTLTQLMLTQAITDLAELDNSAHSLRLSVNVTPELLLSGTGLRCLESILPSSGIKAGRITLEILEGCNSLSLEEARERIREVKELGLRVALDDIGSAYSSLLRLKELPIDEIKLGQDFVHTLKTNPNGFHFIATLLDLSRSLRVDFVAEGCETSDVLDALKVLNVPMVQGYAIAPAMSFDVLRDWLLQARPLREDSLHSLLGIYAYHLSNFSLLQGMALKNPQWLAEIPMQAIPSFPINRIIASGGLTGTAIDVAHHMYHRALEATINTFKAEGMVDWTAAEDAATFFQQSLLEAIREKNGDGSA